jgi:hypothetical protein
MAELTSTQLAESIERDKLKLTEQSKTTGIMSDLQNVAEDSVTLMARQMAFEQANCHAQNLLKCMEFLPEFAQGVVDDVILAKRIAAAQKIYAAVQVASGMVQSGNQ